MAQNTPLSILIVEDEAIVAMMLEDMVVNLGHEVAAVAGRLDHALKLAEDLTIDLAVLDVNLNGERSFPIASVLARRNIPFIFATGYGVVGLSEEWRSRPVLQKPCVARELEAAIEAALVDR